MNLFVARQPIFHLDGGIAGYELLYRRNGEAENADAGDSVRMSSDVIVQGFLELGLDRLTGGTRGFVNFGRDMLLDRTHDLLHPASVVIEVLEDVEADALVVEVCRDMRRAGYSIALDDFVPGGSQETLIPLASIIKLDLLDRSTEEVEVIAAHLRPHGVTLLAERVENEQVYHAARDSGFSLFQGYHFSRPQTIAHSSGAVAAMGLIPLMNALLDDRVTDADVESLFRRDPALSYKLLRIVSSASYGGRGIGSIQHAVQIVGRRPLHRWLTLLLASSLASGSGFAHELVQATLARARLLELLATEAGSNPGAMVLLGMFSNMDSLLQLPMPDLLQRVTLASEVRDALLRLPGATYLPWLEMVESYEAGEWENAMRAAEGLGSSAEALPRLYPEALQWATSTLDRLETA